MGSNGINVVAIAQGSSECSISFVVAESDLERAVIALHDPALEICASLNECDMSGFLCQVAT